MKKKLILGFAIYFVVGCAQFEAMKARSRPADPKIGMSSLEAILTREPERYTCYEGMLFCDVMATGARWCRCL